LRDELVLVDDAVERLAIALDLVEEAPTFELNELLDAERGEFSGRRWRVPSLHDRADAELSV
jgi:hypothetical protein